MLERALSLRNYVLARPLSSPWLISSLSTLQFLPTPVVPAPLLTALLPVNQTAGPDCMLKPNEGYQRCLDKTKSDLIVATVLSAMIGSFAMGILANLPFGLAPGMGPNAFVAYNLVGFHGSGPISYKTAMAIVLLEGCAFFIVSALGLREKLARIIPKPIRLACAAGIGLFIAFVGLQVHQGMGLVGPDQSTLVTMTACSSTNPATGECISGKMRSPTFWLGSVGLLITCYGLMKEIKGSMIYGILFVTLVSWIRGTAVTYFPQTLIGDTKYKYFKKVVGFHKIHSTAGAISFTNLNTSDAWLALATLFYVDMLGTTGTLYTMAEVGGFVDGKGKLRRAVHGIPRRCRVYDLRIYIRSYNNRNICRIICWDQRRGQNRIDCCDCRLIFSGIIVFYAALSERASVGYRAIAGDSWGDDDEGGEGYRLGEHEGGGAGFHHHDSNAANLLCSKWDCGWHWIVRCSELV
ncbi:hypothetical protein OIU78_030029 [Salix suchowensis]|nr:hypothetical protein OIU78_030029 [Salix suchowensis]